MILFIDEDDGYLKPKMFQEFYKTCPAPRPLILSSNLNVTATCEWSSPLSGYTTMKTPGILNVTLLNFDVVSTDILLFQYALTKT